MASLLGSLTVCLSGMSLTLVKAVLSSENKMEVRFASAVKPISDKPYKKYSAIFDRSGTRVYIRKMQMCL
jgi:hypothetical protein